MSKTRTRPWNVGDHLERREDIVAYLKAAFEDGDPALIAAALGDIARSKGITAIARRTGLGRESLYKSLSRGGNPQLATLLRVLDALDLRLRAIPKDPVGKSA